MPSAARSSAVRRLAHRRVGRRRIRQRQLGEALVATRRTGRWRSALRFGLSATPDDDDAARIEQRSRAWIFVDAGAGCIVAAGLLVPLVRTIYLSFQDRNSEEFVGWTTTAT